MRQMTITIDWTLSQMRMTIPRLDNASDDDTDRLDYEPDDYT